MKLIFLPETTGFGHISRCVGIAEAVKRLGRSVWPILVMKYCEEEVEQLLKLFGIETVYYENYQELEMILEKENDSTSMIIEDFVLFPDRLINQKKFYYSIIVQPNLIYPEVRLKKADLLISCSPHWYVDPQLEHYTQKTIRCGPLLHLSEDEQQSDKGKCRQYLGIDQKSFVVTVMGGGGRYGIEIYDLVAKTLPFLKKKIRNLDVFFIVGPFASCYKMDAYQQWGTIKRCVLSSFFYIKASDVIISHGGYQTLMEVLKAKTPAIFFPRNKEQELNVTLFRSPWLFYLDRMDTEELLDLTYKASMIKKELISSKIVNGTEMCAKKIVQFLKTKQYIE
jgi:spore coat polysaccharide biosynthesis predicted glycosyltransferase SpsG